MTSFKITDKMADAVLNAQSTQTLAGERLKITSDVHDRVCAGLQNRGLVEYVKISDVQSKMVLSADGVKVLRLLKNQYHMRSFDLDCGEEMIAILAGETQPEPVRISTQSARSGKIYRSDGSVSPAPTQTEQCGRTYKHNRQIVCRLDKGHQQLHRNAHTGYTSWTDAECSDAPGRANVREV